MATQMTSFAREQSCGNSTLFLITLVVTLSYLVMVVIHKNASNNGQACFTEDVFGIVIE